MFKGSMVALVTPFQDGAVDFDTLETLVNWHIEQGTHAIVPVGTTGESPTLTHDEHDAVVETVVKTTAGRVPVIAGAGSNNTTETIRLVTHAKKVGADAALVVTPYYNRPTQSGLITHFEAAAACELPIIIYNIPPRSVVDMLPETMGKLAQNPYIIGVKDATGDLSRVPTQRISCGTDFLQISGEDMTALGYNAHGGVGCISVSANVVPKLCAEFQQSTLRGDFKTALEQLDRLAPLHQAIFAEPGVCGAKYALSLLGMCREDVRSPLTPLETRTKDMIRSAMTSLGLIG